MKISFVFRSQDRKEYSIEALFKCLVPWLETSFDVEECYLPFGRYNRLKCLWGDYKEVKRIQADVIHITGEVNFVALAVDGKKTIITIHDYADLEKMTGAKKIVRWLFWHYIPYKKSKYLTCVSKKTLQETLLRFPFVKNKAFYIPNPISELYCRNDKEFDYTCPQILVVGTRTNKNVERIIKAVSSIKCKLFIVGALSKRQKDLLKRLNVSYKNVCFISDEEMYNAYCDCDMLCFPSIYEGFGRPIIEANAVGRPVITSNIEPMIEVSNESAVLVNPFDIDSIHKGVMKIIEEKELRNLLVSKGYENAEKYRSKKVYVSYKELYDSIGNNVE